MNDRDTHDSSAQHAAADTPFESALRAGLRRVDAPAMMAAKLARAAEAETERRQRSELFGSQRGGLFGSQHGGLFGGQRGWWHRVFSGRASGAAAPRESVFALQRAAGLWFAGAVAAAVVVSAGIGGAVHERNRHASEAATRDFALSQQIEQQALAHTRTQLRHAGIDLGD